MIGTERGKNYAGIYYSEYEYKYDKHDFTVDNDPNIRLLPGFSYSGVINRPVLIRSNAELDDMFGGIDRRLEKKQCWFNRFIRMCLMYGPVLAINLRAYKDVAKEQVSIVGMNSSADDNVKLSLNDIFDTNHFYTPSPDRFKHKITNELSLGNDIYIANTSSNSYTYFIVKSDYEQDYDVTIEDFYNGDEMPAELTEFIKKERVNRNENSFEQLHTLNEFLYSVYVYKGDWTEQLNSKAVKFITDNGGTVEYSGDGKRILSISVKPEKQFFSDLANQCSIHMYRSYTGLTIPYMADSDGNTLSLESMVNSESMNNNMLCCIPDIIYRCDSDDSDSVTYARVLTHLGYGLEPDGTNATQNQLLNVLRDKDDRIAYTDGFIYGKSTMYNLLADKDIMPFRYIVDTFGLGYELNSKDVYSKICDKKMSATAIVNFPSPAELYKYNASSNMYMTVANRIADEDKFSLPDSHNNYCYYPYITVNDIGSSKIDVPPAALVSNLFIKKNNNGKLGSAVAGYNNGIITNISGLSVSLDEDQRNYIAGCNVNPIINTEAGVCIFGNRTTKRDTRSVLSSLHCNELNVYIYNMLDAASKEFVFEMNDASTRNQLVEKLKTKLSMVQATYPDTFTGYSVTAEEDDPEHTLIENLIGVLDIYLEYAKAYEKVFIRMTIVKK